MVSLPSVETQRKTYTARAVLNPLPPKFTHCIHQKFRNTYKHTDHIHYCLSSTGELTQAESAEKEDTQESPTLLRCERDDEQSTA